MELSTLINATGAGEEEAEQEPSVVTRLTASMLLPLLNLRLLLDFVCFMDLR